MKESGEILECFSYTGSTKTKALELVLCIEQLLDKYKPDLVIFEATFTRFKRAASVLSLYQGLIYNSLLRYGIPTYTIGNRMVKNEFGTHEKSELFKTICSLYNITNLGFDEFNDEIDAIAIGLTYLLRGIKCLKKFD